MFAIYSNILVITTTTRRLLLCEHITYDIEEAVFQNLLQEAEENCKISVVTAYFLPIFEASML
jgi:hypothetical protein